MFVVTTCSLLEFYSCSVINHNYIVMSVCLWCICLPVPKKTQKYLINQLEHIVVYKKLWHCYIKVRITAGLFSIYHNTNSEVFISHLMNIVTHEWS